MEFVDERASLTGGESCDAGVVIDSLDPVEVPRVGLESELTTVSPSGDSTLRTPTVSVVQSGPWICASTWSSVV